MERVTPSQTNASVVMWRPPARSDDCSIFYPWVRGCTCNRCPSARPGRQGAGRDLRRGITRPAAQRRSGMPQLAQRLGPWRRARGRPHSSCDRPIVTRMGRDRRGSPSLTCEPNPLIAPLHPKDAGNPPAGRLRRMAGWRFRQRLCTSAALSIAVDAGGLRDFHTTGECIVQSNCATAL